MIPTLEAKAEDWELGASLDYLASSGQPRRVYRMKPALGLGVGWGGRDGGVTHCIKISFKMI